MYVHNSTHFFSTHTMASRIENKGDSSLDKEDRDAYNFSQQAYQSSDKRTNIGSWQYDKALSNHNTAVWHDRDKKRTHVSNRGSTSAYDWLVSDAQIATGMEGRGARFNKAIDITKKAHEKHGYSVSTSGHSLGGQLSAYTTEKLGDQSWYLGGTGFNPGNSSVGRASMFSKQRRECRRKNPPAYCNKQTTVQEKGDYVSSTNIACDTLTFGFGGDMCRKTTAFGNTKLYNHHRKRPLAKRLLTRAVPALRYFSNAKDHSLNVFKK